VAETTEDGEQVEHIKRKPITLAAVCRQWPDAANRQAVRDRDVVFVRNLIDASGCIGATITLNKYNII
jgi:hypothetical protein